MNKNLSIVIPTLGYHSLLESTLQSAAKIQAAEIIVVSPIEDGYFEELFTKYNCSFLIGPKGRGPALAFGEKNATGDWILFLHSDTVLSPLAASEISTFTHNPKNIERAAYFTFKQDASDVKSWLLEYLVALRCLVLAMPYGDQGLLISKKLYHHLKGFREDYPMMEDVDFILKIGRRRLHRFKSPAITSSIRYKNRYLKRILRNARCLFLYFAGTSPKEIAKIYE